MLPQVRQKQMAMERTLYDVIVSSEVGLQMHGITVVDNQTVNGIVTDDAGAFTLTIPDKVKTLQVSYIGYKTKEVPVTGQNMRIILDPDLVSIDEVMVVAYGTGKKSTFTGSASVVKKESLEKIKASNVTQAFKGQIIGVTVFISIEDPGAGPKIFIRALGWIYVTQRAPGRVGVSSDV